MNIRSVAAREVAPNRWRNGAGWTRELASWPSPADWTVRVSVADIESDGDFSSYPRVDRWFAVVEGKGVALGIPHADSVVLTTASAMIAFPGDDAPSCALLDGRVRDVNFMVRRDRASASVQSVPPQTALTGSAPWAGIFVVDACRLALAGEAAVLLPPLSFAWVENPDRAEYAFVLEDAPERGWWIELGEPRQAAASLRGESRP